jgi:predicted alpha/beta superfamily hydrolase
MVGLNKKIKKVSSQYNIIYMTDGNMLYKKELLWFKRPTFLCIEE